MYVCVCVCVYVCVSVSVFVYLYVVISLLTRIYISLATIFSKEINTYRYRNKYIYIYIYNQILYMLCSPKVRYSMINVNHTIIRRKYDQTSPIKCIYVQIDLSRSTIFEIQTHTRAHRGTIQMIALLRTARIRRLVLMTWGDLLSLKLPGKTIN